MDSLPFLQICHGFAACGLFETPRLSVESWKFVAVSRKSRGRKVVVEATVYAGWCGDSTGRSGGDPDAGELWRGQFGSRLKVSPSPSDRYFASE